MSMYDDFDEIAFQVNIEGVEQGEQDEEPVVDFDTSDEERDEDPYDWSV